MAKKIVIARQLSSNKEMQTMVILSGSIAHELKNYLTAINISAELSEDKLKSIREKVKEATYLINNLQLRLKCLVAGKPSTKEFKRYSMLRNIREALDQYPFATNEARNLMKVKTLEDFEYEGDPLLTNHILYNLIRNALCAIKNADKEREKLMISIRLESGIRFNKVVFRDTATGISKKFLPQMFKLFASRMVSQGGTGIGLAFCKMIMDSYGGSIVCDSVEGEYTEFTLKFPSIRIN